MPRRARIAVPGIVWPIIPRGDAMGPPLPVLPGTAPQQYADDPARGVRRAGQQSCRAQKALAWPLFDRKPAGNSDLVVAVIGFQ